jgi:hypothetical protein
VRIKTGVKGTKKQMQDARIQDAGSLEAFHPASWILYPESGRL